MHEHAATRLFVFPVASAGRRWAFVAKPPSLLPLTRSPHQNPKPDDTSTATILPGTGTPAQHPATITANGAAPTISPEPPPGPHAATTAKPGWLGNLVSMSREVLARSRLASNNSERVEVVSDYLADKMHEQWVQLEAAPEKTWRRWVFNWGTALLSRLKASESLFKTLPKKAPGIEIVYPAGLNPKLVRRRVRLLAQGGERLHQRSLYVATGVLPFVMLLGVLPVPNLPFFWNIFRVHAHWSALRGARRMLELATVPPPLRSKEEEENHQQQRQPHRTPATPDSSDPHVHMPPLRLLESTDLAAFTRKDLENFGQLSDETVAELSKALDLDPQLVTKWRDQKEK